MVSNKVKRHRSDRSAAHEFCEFRLAIQGERSCQTDKVMITLDHIVWRVEIS